MIIANRSFLLAGDDPPSKVAILEHALALFVRDGLCETSIRDIAEASGYTNPALYKFFPSKDALALHLFERCYGYLSGRLAGALAADGKFEDKLDALLTTFLELLDEDLDAVLYANETLRTFWRKLPPRARRHSVLGALRGLLEVGVRERALRRDLDLSLAVALLVGTFGQIARMAHFHELPRPCVQSFSSLRLMLNGALC